MSQHPIDFTSEDIKDFQIIEELRLLYDRYSEHEGSFDFYKVFELMCTFKRDFIHSLGQRVYLDFKNEQKEKNH